MTATAQHVPGPIRRSPEYRAYVADWIAAAEKPGRRLQLYGALIFLAFGLREWHLFGEAAWPARCWWSR